MPASGTNGLCGSAHRNVTIAEASAEIYGIKFAAVSPPVAIAYVHIGLHGTVSKSAPVAGTTVTALGTARVSLGRDYVLECLGDCPPIRVPITGRPHPRRTIGTAGSCG